nr:membrane protein b160 [Mastomys natalensis cytomegalovirus 3]WEG69976.1 membrane protein b160 [Mastomys natalensis cytomegalovirus 3]WEG70116.1 membrane protein b160 [Mastomys natalensis cytomegalovirus 3]WEG70256.1 membrane protein b160 [Mastomys natalensis cytomegalovirus 3]WEG70396.1 membrane protein b160 [Mastomys natalensis cytomegalovirus 3]
MKLIFVRIIYIHCVLQAISCMTLPAASMLNFQFSTSMNKDVYGVLSTLYTPNMITFVNDMIEYACIPCPREDNLVYELRFIRKQITYLHEMNARLQTLHSFINYNIYIQPNYTDVTVYFGTRDCLFSHSTMNNITTQFEKSNCSLTNPYWNETGLEELIPNVDDLWIKWKKVAEKMNVAALNINASLHKMVTNNITTVMLRVESKSLKRIRVHLSTYSKYVETTNYKRWWNNGYSEAECNWTPHTICTIISVNQWITHVILQTSTHEHLEILLWDWPTNYETCEFGWIDSTARGCIQKREGTRTIMFEYQVTPEYIIIVPMCSVVIIVLFVLYYLLRIL